MERLTIEYDGYFVPKKMCTIDRFGEADDCEACFEQCKGGSKDCSECPVQKCFNRLAEYEDTGLTPDQIKEIDRLYTEKCKELAEIKKEIEKLSDKYLSEVQACADKGDKRTQAMKEHVVFALMQVIDIVKESEVKE